MRNDKKRNASRTPGGFSLTILTASKFYINYNAKAKSQRQSLLTAVNK